MNEKARQAEKAASRGHTRTVYRFTQEVVDKPSSHERPVKIERGGLLTDVEEKKQQWASCF